MSDTSTSDKQMVQLKRKLDAATSSRTVLENDFKAQSTMLIDFIGRLSQTCKGQDKTLDSKLANLRNLLKTAAPLNELQEQISNVSTLLQQHSKTNEANIEILHSDFLASGKSLQKMSGLPSGLRRELRSLLQSNDEKKDAIIEYIPIFNQLIHFYTTLLASKENTQGASLSAQSIANNSHVVDKDTLVNKEFIEKFSGILNELALSDINTKQLSTVKAKIKPDMSNDNLLDRFFEVFDVIVEDLKNERNTAKAFLSTLSNTLATVQSAVKNTLEVSTSTGSKHEKLNHMLQKQVGDMATDISKATSLANIKNDINEKLKLISSTLKKKSVLEKEQNAALKSKMQEMVSKVETLEEQSKTFEKRIQEQQAKSMEDALTKLANRAAFDDYYAKALLKFHSKNFDLAIIVLDLDDFKRINDTYGHTAGDKTLQVIANTLRKHIDDNTFVARYGGEEFVLIISNADQQKVLKKLNVIRQQIARLPFKFKNDKVNITVSVGASHITKEDNTHTAFERADEALYQAKAQGKNQVVYT